MPPRSEVPNSDNTCKETKATSPSAEALVQAPRLEQGLCKSGAESPEQHPAGARYIGRETSILPMVSAHGKHKNLMLSLNHLLLMLQSPRQNR